MNSILFSVLQIPAYGKVMKKRLLVAIRDAERATTLSVSERLQEFSFVSRYLGKIGNKRKKTSKLGPQSKKMKKQKSKDDDDESSLCSEESYDLRKAQLISLTQENKLKPSKYNNFSI